MPITNAQIAAMETITPTSMLIAWKQAEATIALTSQSYTMYGRQLTRANLPEIREAIKYWQGVVNAEAAGADGGGVALVQLGEAQ